MGNFWILPAYRSYFAPFEYDVDDPSNISDVVALFENDKFSVPPNFGGIEISEGCTIAHIHGEGLLPMEWCTVWWAVSLVLLALSLYKARVEDPRKIVRTAILSAFSFGAMQLSFPVAGGIHLDFISLIGILSGPYLGYLAAFTVNLFCMMIGHGGITTAGANTILLGFFEAMLAYWIFKGSSRFVRNIGVRGCLATFLSLTASALAMTVMLSLGMAVSPLTYTIILAHLLVAAVIEAVITAMILQYISRVRSDILEA